MIPPLLFEIQTELFGPFLLFLLPLYVLTDLLFIQTHRTHTITVGPQMPSLVPFSNPFVTFEKIEGKVPLHDPHWNTLAESTSPRAYGILPVNCGL